MGSNGPQAQKATLDGLDERTAPGQPGIKQELPAVVV
jgi:hypothetical protein